MRGAILYILPFLSMESKTGRRTAQMFEMKKFNLIKPNDMEVTERLSG